jgi:2-succinyl-6-hydroxy-2,4-cyclohexadiene-1-carboxylate synthase
MGGRAALSYAVNYPQKICGLVLESSTTGISSENLRIERIERDKELSKFILENSIESFVDYWLSLDLFHSQKNLPAEKLIEIREAKLNNDRTGLANMLKGFSIGKMEPLFDRVKDIPAITLLISGELDEKFTTINSQIVNNFQSANHTIIKNAGHNTHLEQPSLYLSAVNNFLKQF